MPQDLTCRCGQVALHLTGWPFITATCYCTSCQEAADRLASLPVTPAMVDEAGGTAYRMYRKDRVILTGAEYLAAYRLSAKTSTRRYVTTCCNTPMFLELSGGHWLSIYNGIFPDAASFRPEILTQTGPAKGPLPDVPHGALTTLRFFGRLAKEWVAMRFKTPKLPPIRDTVL